MTLEEELEKNGLLYYTCRGTSMNPLIYEYDDVVLIKKVEKQPLKKYTCVLFKRDDKYVLHRIKKVKKHGYNIIGDNQIYVERNVKFDQILGVLENVQKPSGEVINALPDKYLQYLKHRYFKLPFYRFIDIIKRIIRKMIGKNS